MLSSIVNRFSARAEHLDTSVARLAAQRDTEIGPFEEEEQWLRRRLRVLDAQIALLREHPRPGPETSQDRYQATLNTLAHEFVSGHRQRLDNRLSDIVPRTPARGPGGELARHQRSLQQFEERVAAEMACHRQFCIERPEPRPQSLVSDLEHEKESIETILHALRDNIATMSAAVERTACDLSGRLTDLRRERESALADAQRHEQWLSACAKADLVNVIAGMRRVALEERAAFINRLGDGGRNALHLACETTDVVIANLLLSAGGSLEVPTDRGRLPIHMACRRDCGAQTGTFLSWLKGSGADVNACDGDGRGPLNEAAYYGNVSAVRWLVQNGCQLTACDRQGRTALHVAAAAGQAAMVEELLALGVDPTSANRAGERPLVEALRNGHATVAIAFFDRGLWLSASEIAALQGSAAWQVAAVRHAFWAPVEQQLAKRRDEALRTGTSGTSG
ncbi:ankyrin repeat domain-containing protein [Cupriavidus respiraculi]|uniref:ankyrin repeat domain-containing protein n=1 Tax=Cupriavidus respiraculi TaxID=195930 RepID=UPI001C963ECB|nr:ankyrin repeat domain-containing protein [Cupriavidus respiraculi]MBY4948381.1 ankyrin repeat domain-containing protein [Cupriavidus respiraculi]